MNICQAVSAKDGSGMYVILYQSSVVKLDAESDLTMNRQILPVVLCLTRSCHRHIQHNVVIHYISVQGDLTRRLVRSP